METTLADGTRVFVLTYDRRPAYSGVIAGTVDDGARYVVRPLSPELEEVAVPRSFVVRYES